MPARKTIYVIDDQAKNIENAGEVFSSPDERLIYKEKLVYSEATWLEAAEELLALEGDFIIVLDLGLRDQGDPAWRCAEDLIRTHPRLTAASVTLDADGTLHFPVDGQAFPLPSDTLDGIALAVKATDNRNPGKTLVYIASARGGTGSLDDFIAFLNGLFAQGAGSKRLWHFVRDIKGRSLSLPAYALLISKEVERQWRRFSFSLHSSGWINDAIRSFIDFHRALNDKQDRFCQHGQVGEDGTLQGSRSQYVRLVCEMFGSNKLQCLESDVEGLKAVLMLPKAAAQFPAVHFTEWQPDQTSECGRLIGREALHAVLSAASSRAVEVKVREARLPLKPALPFLLAFRHLVEELMAQDGNMLHDALPIELDGSNAGYRLLIPLRRDDRAPAFGLARRWIEKHDKEGGFKTGVCKALWQTCRAQVEISLPSDLDARDRAMLSLLNGPARPIAGVTFAPHFIHLFWPGS